MKTDGEYAREPIFFFVCYNIANRKKGKMNQDIVKK